MNILVTGGDGQLGLSLKKISAEYPDHTFTFTDLPEADITDCAVMERIVRETAAELIINCAAYTAVDRAEIEPEVARKVNCDGAGTLAEIAAKHDISLIHISTDYVFDGSSLKPIKEEDLPNPQSVYGLTKLEGEQAIRAAGCDAAVIRTSWLYSEFGNNFVKTMLAKGRSVAQLRVVDDQKGSPTYATDLARAIMVLAVKRIKGFEIYNYSDSGETTWYGFACEIFMLAGMKIMVTPITSEEYPTAAKRPYYSVLSTNKIKNSGAVIPFWTESLSKCIGILKR